MKLAPIFNIAEICHKHGLRDVVLSPGSRCAPLTLAFARHHHMQCKTISDERSAAFIALGMSQKTKLPTALVCTSGSASLNYAPAIAEAYFQQVPMIIFTADRPPEWIDQYDGQTIRQSNIYGQHVKQSLQLPVDLSHEDAVWHSYRIISEAINTAKRYPQGPVHVNIPFREPFYPTHDEHIKYDTDVKVFEEAPTANNLPDQQWHELLEVWKTSHKKLIVGGQDELNPEFIEILDQMIAEQKVPVIGDIISNLHGVEQIISHPDVFLGSEKRGLQESLKPNLLVTFGKSTLSKNLKLFLRKNKATVHWHIQPAGKTADTFQSLTKVLKTTPEHFFTKVNEIKLPADFNTQKQENYYHLWEIEERKTKRLLETFFPQEPLGEFEMVYHILSNLKEANLHLSNSMAVRYANFIGLKPEQKVNVYANRGTSGIDGCTSTAMGAALADGRETILITGDLAFFYDRNAFWHNYAHKLKVVVLNNHAGGIFRIIAGPAEQPELEEYFETKQQLSAKNLAEEFSIPYIKCDKRGKLKNQLNDFITTEGPAILELETDSAANKATLDTLKALFKNQE